MDKEEKRITEIKEEISVLQKKLEYLDRECITTMYEIRELQVLLKEV